MLTTKDPNPGPFAHGSLPGRLEVVVGRPAEFQRDREVEVEVTLHHMAATVGDLAAALGLGSRDHVLVDARPAPLGLPLVASGVRRGSRITVGGDGKGSVPVRGLALRTLSGPDSGREIPLPPGLLVLGRGAGVDIRVDDPSLARRHTLIESGDRVARVTDLAPPRPSRIGDVVVGAASLLRPGDVLVVGSTRMALGDARGSEAAGAARGCPGGTWTSPLRRPPRPPAPAPIPPVAVPTVAQAPAGPSPLGLATVGFTLVAATVVAVVLHQPALLLLGAVGATGTVGAALWQRWRHRKNRRAASSIQQEALVRFGRELTEYQALAAELLRTHTMEVADAVACARSGGAALWATRLGDAGALRATVGRGDRLSAPVLDGDPRVLGDQGWAVVEACSTVTDVPVAVDLGPGAVVGVVGPAPFAASLARSLVIQQVVSHGPAELRVAGLFPSVADDVDPAWLAWLPHAAGPSGERLVASGGEIGEVLEALGGTLGVARSGSPPHGPGMAPPHVLLVVLDPSLLAARNTPARRFLAGAPSAAAIVVAGEAESLPGLCTTVIEIRADGTALLHRPGSAELADRVAVAGISALTARDVALALAGLHDPEQPECGAGLPAVASAAASMASRVGDPDRMRSAWAAAGQDPPLRTLLAVAADGAVEVDLVRDGPHALVAGTTGSGKSELLRSLIAGLAAGTGPDHLSFVLVDYKGGAAFDACARLPHVVGVVTDLDERLAERALRSLDAELRRRERILRDAGVADLSALRAQPGQPPLPRLVVVVDEFASLAADVPGFVPSLVGVAQRGRSLGVHLILATQRPAGVVSDDIRANANLRIALRVQDAADSLDVVGDPIAASLPRSRPGRAVVRFGPGELVTVQVSAVTLPVPSPTGDVLTVRATGPGSGSGGPPGRGSAPADAPTLLELLVDTASRAAAGRAEDAHRPWLPPLPEHVWWEELPPGAAGLSDDPDHQAQEPWAWHEQGHLLCIGTVGAGTSEALVTLALALAAARSPADLYLYLVPGTPELAALEQLPHVGASIAPTEVERQARFIRRLGSWLDERTSAGGAAGPWVVVVVEQLAVWRQAVVDRLGPELADVFDRVLVEGPALGLTVLGGLDRPGALPLAVSGAVGERLVFRLGDPGDAMAAGLRPASVAGLPDGRAVVAGSGLTVQMAQPHGGTAAAVATLAARHRVPAGRGAPLIAPLPSRVPVVRLPAPAPARAGAAWWLPLGLEDVALAPVGLVWHPGDHVVVAGPARSGRSSALALIAHQLGRTAGARVRLLAIAPRPSALAAMTGVEMVEGASALREAAAAAAGAPLVVLVDDAELVDDPCGSLAAFASGSVGGVSIVAAGRLDALRAGYGHWTQVARRSRRGVLLRPESDVDGDLLGAVLPRRQPTPPAAGRGYLVADGTCRLVQLADPELPAASE